EVFALAAAAFPAGRPLFLGVKAEVVVAFWGDALGEAAAFAGEPDEEEAAPWGVAGFFEGRPLFLGVELEAVVAFLGEGAEEPDEGAAPLGDAGVFAGRPLLAGGAYASTLAAALLALEGRPRPLFAMGELMLMISRSSTL
ncbi:hypothetical protein PMAYCL1PPCAC_24605, partial [Pristionchus mayeri]